MSYHSTVFSSSSDAGASLFLRFFLSFRIRSPYEVRIILRVFWNNFIFFLRDSVGNIGI